MRRLRAAVVGGGIIGTAVARHLGRAVDGAEVVLYEKEARLAGHQSGHNSGVVHAGLYYEPGSLKALLCRRGVTLLAEFAAQHGLAYQECGKLVVALDDREIPRLEALYRRALANGVPDVRVVGPEELREVEPHAVGLRAVHSPRTAVVDYQAVTMALADQVTQAGGSLRMRHEVTGLVQQGRKVRVVAAGNTDEFDLVIVCAGLQSDRLARLAGEPRDPRIVPFFGDYFLLPEAQEHLVNGLIYPVPDPRYPFLGVHVTKRVDGSVLLGPNAFLSPGRESYAPRHASARDLREALGFPGLWRFAVANAPAAVRELRTAMSPARFVAEATRYLPEIDRTRVRRGPRGVRAQAMDARGRLLDDFVITGTDRMVHVRNAPSPGATSALAIAEHVVTEALRRGGLPAVERSPDR